MRLNLQKSRSQLSPRKRSARRGFFNLAIEALESRQLMASTTTGEVASTIPPVLATPSSPSNDSITLNQYFTDSTLPGTLVTFNTSEGTIQVGLTDAATPLTVENFLNYVTSGAYNDTIFHRSAFLDGSGTPSSTTPADIIQGGGYSISDGGINHIATNAPVEDEYQTELYGDVAGTLAMAKTSEANSATSEWYFNENDNTELDTPTTDANGETTSYTVFGKVLSGMNIVTAIASLPTYDLNSTLTNVPVTGLTQAQADAGASLSENNLVFVTSVVSEPGTSYTVTSDTPALVTPIVTDGVLSFNYGSGVYGTADITVNATNLDGTTASTTFPVTVPNTAIPGQGPVAGGITSSSIVTGVQGAVHTLSTATDSVQPLTTTGVTIVTQPMHGTATVDTTTGYIDYTATGGFSGTDTLTYTVTDAAGTVSSPATMTLDVVPLPVTVTVGSGGVKGLTFIQPDGAVGQLSVSGGTATVTFTDYQVTTTNSGGIVTAKGSGATITGITIINSGHAASLSVLSASAVSIGSVNDTGVVSKLNAPNATMTGKCTFGGLLYLNIGATDNATIVAPGNYIKVMIGTATNTALQAFTIGSLKSKQWLTTDGASHLIYASSISLLDVTGAFAENVQLTGKGYNMFLVNVAQPSGEWQLEGSVFRSNISSPASTWSLTVGGIIQQLTVKGTLSSTIEAAAIASIIVTGSLSGAVLQTDASSSDKTYQIEKLLVTGAATNSTILAAGRIGSVTLGSISGSAIYAGEVVSNGSIVDGSGKYSKSVLEIAKISIAGAASNGFIASTGNIGSISAASFSGTRIYAGVMLADAQAGSLADATTDLLADASIASVAVTGRAKSSYSDSQIDAYSLGSLRLGDIATSNSGTTQGIAARLITAITATLDGKTRLVLGPPELRASKSESAMAVLNAYLVKEKIVTGTTNAVNDFAIDLY